jgi:hypothetical protein
LGVSLGSSFDLGGSGKGSGAATGKGSGALGGASSTLSNSGTLIESNLKLGSQIAANMCKLMDSIKAQTKVWLSKPEGRGAVCMAEVRG